MKAINIALVLALAFIVLASFGIIVLGINYLIHGEKDQGAFFLVTGSTVGALISYIIYQENKSIS